MRLYVESILRYGLPAEYSAIALEVSFFRTNLPSSSLFLTCARECLKPNSKTSVKTLKSLASYFGFLKSKEKALDKSAANVNTEEIAGEWGAVMEQEYFDFVLFEVPKVAT